MKVSILCIGKTREPFVQEGIKKYLRYLRPYATVEIRELREEAIDDLKDAPRVRRKEAERIEKALTAGVRVVALDERGKSCSSHEFAEFLSECLESGSRGIMFIIGGAMGLDDSVLARAHRTLSLSRWTFTHEMARLVLLEQLYRAFTIIKGRPYHY
jgi:23S rRNA (pseudouridine1915-N3)-methyltransferase